MSASSVGSNGGSAPDCNEGLSETTADGSPGTTTQEMERWAQQTLHPAAQRIVWGLIRRHPRALDSYPAGSLGPPSRLLDIYTTVRTRGPKALPGGLAIRLLRGPAILAAVRATDAEDMAVRADMHALPEYLDRIDGWLHDGALSGDPGGVVEQQLASPLSLLMTLGDVRPMVQGRPCEALARGVYQHSVGEVPSRVAPDYWLTELPPA